MKDRKRNIVVFSHQTGFESNKDDVDMAIDGDEDDEGRMLQNRS